MSELRQVDVPCFDTVDNLRFGLASKSDFTSNMNLYPRDGTEQLVLAEARAADLARVNTEDLALFTSGMAAITTAIEVAAANQTAEKTVIACGEQLYSQTAVYLGRYALRPNIKVVRFDSGKNSDIERVLGTHKPNVIVCETVANGPDIPVLDVEFMLKTITEQPQKPVAVLDNTLPLSTGLPLGQRLSKEHNVLVVESGTKSYTQNSELSGVIYSKNQPLLDTVRAYRRTAGTMPGIGSVERILDLLPETRQAFDERNRRLYANTGILALKLYNASLSGSDFIVSHPNLPTHDNTELTSTEYPEGCTPVLFLQCIGAASQFDLAERLWSSPEVRQYAELGQSFGFDRTRILPDECAGIVRIAGGAESNGIDRLGAALASASLDNCKIND